MLLISTFKSKNINSAPFLKRTNSVKLDETQSQFDMAWRKLFFLFFVTLRSALFRGAWQHARARLKKLKKSHCNCRILYLHLSKLPERSTFSAACGKQCYCRCFPPPPCCSLLERPTTTLITQKQL